MTTVTVLNGPNLNLLGVREPGLYGSQSLPEINERLENLAGGFGIEIRFFQYNGEHQIIENIHLAFEQSVDYIIINPAAYTHTSIAIRDAFLATKIPFIEVHLSNVFAREPFRRHSYLSDIALAVISGLGAIGYELALQAIHLLSDQSE